jgi:hypothetical protein
LRVGSAAQARTIFLYLLVEHQSRPQRFFLLRLAEYLLEAYKMQKRAWDEQHTSDAHFTLQPVLPIVVYTGERRWEEIETLVDLVEAGELFQAVIPTFKPHFLNLRDTAPETLVGVGGFFGQVLWLIRERHAEPAAFRRTLAEVVAALDAMPPRQGTRWRELLWYIHALVYHARNEEEQPGLREIVDCAIQADAHRQEYQIMGRTIAEMYLDQGREQGQLQNARAILLRQLRKRFKRVPRKVEARIAATTNLQELETWLDNFATAAALADVGIPLD